MAAVILQHSSLIVATPAAIRTAHGKPAMTKERVLTRRVMLSAGSQVPASHDCQIVAWPQSRFVLHEIAAQGDIMAIEPVKPPFSAPRVSC